jgi:hypothetical protein
MAVVAAALLALILRAARAALVALVALAPSILFLQAGPLVQAALVVAVGATAPRAQATRVVALVARADCMAVVVQAEARLAAVAELTYPATAAMVQGAQLLYPMRTHQ